MNRLGDAPTDLLFGLIALNNDLVAPAVIPAALQGPGPRTGPDAGRASRLSRCPHARAARPGRVALRRIHQAAGRRRPEEPGHSDRDPLGPRAAGSARRPRAVRQPHRRRCRSGSTVPVELDPRLDDPDRTLLPRRTARPMQGRTSPVTRSWRCWARVGWGSSTRRGSSGSTGSSLSR